ncbi:GumC family protein [Altererythrobacter sp. MTPC7]|uniref:GumC family protein n=1 Tax=Altererythrobacter sp. MTPC7 TaxID=3056567 RepID=UPI0036F39F2F
MAKTANPAANSSLSSPFGDTSVGRLFRQSVVAVRRNLWLALGLVVLGLVLALVATLLQTPRYTAATSLEIDERAQAVLGEGLDTQPVDDNPWDTDRFLNTQLDVLRSRALAQDVATSLELLEDDAFLAAMDAAPPAGTLAEDARGEAVVDLLRDNLDVVPPENSRVVRIAFTSPDAALSARIANAFAAAYIRGSLQGRFESSSYAREFVSGQLDEARERLEASERELNAFARSAGLIRARGNGEQDGSSAGTSITASSLIQVNEAANAARAERIAAEGRWNAERATPLLSSQRVLANSTVQSLMTQKAQLETELQAARQRYLDGHPTVERLQSELAITERQLGSAASNVRNSVRAEFVAARQAEQALAGQVGELRGQTLAEQDRSVRYNTLAREADTNRQIYDELLQRYSELNASAGLSASNVTVIDEADPPRRPSSPNMLVNLLVGLIAGLVAAALAVFLRDQMDDAIRVPEDVEGKLGLPLLGVVPKAQGGNPESELADPHSAVAEAYMALRGSMLYATPAGLPDAFSVTSAEETEGKTTTSLALAEGLARMGKRTVLVDADLRRPSVHRRLGIANGSGTSDYLTSERAAADFLQAGPVEGLSIVTAGPTPASAADLLSTQRLRDMIAELKATHDVVVLDTPPVLGLADAPAVVAQTGAVLFVVEAGRVRSGQLKSALRRLRFVHPAILGAVMTKFDPNLAGNRYSAYYGRDYYRYESAAEGAA